MLFPQPLTRSSLVELSVSFLRKTTKLLMTTFACAAVQFDWEPSTGPSGSTWEITQNPSLRLAFT